MHTYRILFFLIAFLSVLGCERHDLEDSFRFDQEISRLEVDVDSADIVVSPSLDGTSFVSMDVDYAGSEPRWDVYVSGVTLVVELDCRLSCDGDYRIHVPPSVLSRIKVDSGNILVRDLDGNMHVNTDSGNITLENVSGELDLEVDSGNIKGNVSSEVVIADLDSGNLTLRFDAYPTDLDLSADSGNIRIHVPAGAYDIETDVDSGKRNFNDVMVDRSSPSTIYAEVDSGNITINGY